MDVEGPDPPGPEPEPPPKPRNNITVVPAPPPEGAPASPLGAPQREEGLLPVDQKSSIRSSGRIAARKKKYDDWKHQPIAAECASPPITTAAAAPAPYPGWVRVPHHPLRLRNSKGFNGIVKDLLKRYPMTGETSKPAAVLAAEPAANTLGPPSAIASGPGVVPATTTPKKKKKKKNKKKKDSAPTDVSSSSTAIMTPSTPRTTGSKLLYCNWATAREQKSTPPQSPFAAAIPRTETPPMIIIRTAPGICIRIHACESDVSATAAVETDTAKVTAPAGLAVVTKPGTDSALAGVESADVSATAGVETNTAKVTAPAGLAAVTKPGIDSASTGTGVESAEVSATTSVETNTAKVTAPAGLAAATEPAIDSASTRLRGLLRRRAAAWAAPSTKAIYSVTWT